MKQLIADMHMHTLASGHAYGTIREMTAAASEAGLLMIGITEHAPGIPGTVTERFLSQTGERGSLMSTTVISPARLLEMASVLSSIEGIPFNIFPGTLICFQPEGLPL